jgi:hypothetical protein
VTLSGLRQDLKTFVGPSADDFITELHWNTAWHRAVEPHAPKSAQRVELRCHLNISFDWLQNQIFRLSWVAKARHRFSSGIPMQRRLDLGVKALEFSGTLWYYFRVWMLSPTPWTHRLQADSSLRSKLSLRDCFCLFSELGF